MNSQEKIVSGYVPKYRQLLDILRNRILSSEFAPGDKLPSEEELILAYEVSRGTVRKAVAQLEAEKLVRTEQGIGSFVHSMHPRAIPFHFIDSRSVEQDSSYEMLAQEVVPAPLDVAERLRILPGTPVIHIGRRRWARGRAVAHTVRYLPEVLCPSVVHEDLTVRSVHELLVRNSELPLLRAEVEIEAHKLTPEEALCLDTETGAAGIVVERLTYTAPNRPAVWYRGLFREEYYLGVQVNLGEC